MAKYYFFIVSCGILVAVVMIICGRYTTQKLKTIESKYNQSLESATEAYSKSLAVYQYKLSELQKNNVTTTKTVYLPSGGKIVTHIVDKTIKSRQEDVKVANVDTEKDTSRISNFTSQTFKESISEKRNYLIGVDYQSKFSVVGGVRIFSLPMFLTVEVPVNTDFYKHPTIGILYNF